MEEKNVNELQEVKADDTKTEEIHEENAAPLEEKKGSAISRFGKTLWRWTKRTFMGGTNAYLNEKDDDEDGDDGEKDNSKVF